MNDHTPNEDVMHVGRTTLGLGRAEHEEIFDNVQPTQNRELNDPQSNLNEIKIEEDLEERKLQWPR